MKIFFGILFLYVFLAVMLLPLAVTLLLGGFGSGTTYIGIFVLF